MISPGEIIDRFIKKSGNSLNICVWLDGWTYESVCLCNVVGQKKILEIRKKTFHDFSYI